MLKTANIDRFEDFTCPKQAGGARLALALTIALHAVVIGALAAITLNVSEQNIEPVEIEASFTPSPTQPIDPAHVENVAKQKPYLPPTATAPQLVELPYEPLRINVPDFIQPEIESDLPPFAEVAPAERTAPPPKPTPQHKSSAPPQKQSVAKPKPTVFTQATVRSRSRPSYPESARRKGQQGTAHVRLSVNSAGRVTGATISTSSGTPALDASALKAAKRWKFTPARSGGTPVATTLVVPISFRLN